MAEEQIQEEGKSEGEASSSSQKDGYWGDPYTEILMGLEQIKALGDLLVSVIGSTMNFYKDKNYSPFDLDSDTLPTIGHLIQEKAVRIKCLVEEGY